MPRGPFSFRIRSPFRQAKQGGTAKSAAPQGKGPSRSTPSDAARDDTPPSSPSQAPTISQLQAETEEQFLTGSLADNLKRIEELFGHTADLVIREFVLGDDPPRRAALMQLDGVVDSQFTATELLSRLRIETRLAGPFPEDRRGSGGPSRRLRSRSYLEALERRALSVTGVIREQRLSAIGTALPAGDTLLLVDGEATGLLCATQGFVHRPVQEPSSESGVRVPREGFTEVISINRSLVRRRIRDPRLRFEQMHIGAVTQTEVNIAYVHGIVDPALVAEVRSRLERIKIDGVLESGYLEAFISDHPHSLFPTLRRTERPDTVAAALIEGRVAIFTDGTPFVMMAPVTLPEMLHASEDYYVHWGLTTFVRFFRYASFAISMFAPAVYIALINYHAEMLPHALLHNIAASREGVPFPAALEAIVMLLVFEVLREAGIRLPRIVGSALTIVGALVLGDQTINAGLASPGMVVVVAGTAIASFTIPSYGLDASSRILRIAYVLSAALLGLFGIFVVACLVGMHLCALRSFGVPYLTPFAPLHVRELGDTVYSAPWRSVIKRPRYLSVQEQQRQEPGNKPRPG